MADVIFIKHPDGGIKCWVRRAVIHCGQFAVHAFYTAWQRRAAYSHELMMDDFGTLVECDVYELLRGQVS